MHIRHRVLGVSLALVVAVLVTVGLGFEPIVPFLSAIGFSEIAITIFLTVLMILLWKMLTPVAIEFVQQLAQQGGFPALSGTDDLDHVKPELGYHGHSFEPP